MKRGGQKIKRFFPKSLSFASLTLAIVFITVTNVTAPSINNTALAKGKMSEHDNSSTTYEQADNQSSNAKFVGVVDNGDDDTTDNSNNTTSNTSTDDSTCEEGAGVFGWLLCPGQSLITTAIDAFLGFIENSMQYTFLVDDVDVQTKDGSTVKVGKTSIKEIWGKFVNIANIIFAVAFLIMIYSMATSTGLSNYHVKKILPRIIIMVVIVNLSFYICAAAADISNIIGYNISRFIQDIAPNTGVSRGMLDMFLANLSSVVVAVLSVFFFGGTLLLSLIIIILAVAFRQVLLTVLVIISPIAFALYLLPNTEKWGKQWTDLFIRLLIIYPAFGLVWGVSRLLATTFENIGSTGSSSSIQIPGSIMSVVCGVAPAIAIIPLFKMSGSVMGAVLGAAAGSGIARGMKAKGDSMGRTAGRTISRKPVGAAARFVANRSKDTSRIGLKAREASVWAGKPNSRQERAMKLASLEKSANEQASAIVGGLTQEEQLSALTRNDGKYQDRYGNVKKLGMNLNDPHIYGALMTSQASNLSTEQTGSLTKSSDFQNVASATAARIETLRNNHQYQAADALQTIATTSLSSNKNSNLSAGQINNVLSSGAHADSVYTDTVTKNASSMSKDAAASKSVDQIKEVNSIVGASKDTQAINNWKKTASDVLGDSKFTNKKSTKAQEELKNAKNL